MGNVEKHDAKPAGSSSKHSEEALAEKTTSPQPKDPCIEHRSFPLLLQSMGGRRTVTYQTTNLKTPALRLSALQGELACTSPSGCEQKQQARLLKI